MITHSSYCFYKFPHKLAFKVHSSSKSIPIHPKQGSHHRKNKKGKIEIDGSDLAAQPKIYMEGGLPSILHSIQINHQKLNS